MIMSKNYWIYCLLVGVFLLSAISCADSFDEGPVKDKSEELSLKVLSMSFAVANNPIQLVEDAKCEIVGDSLIDCWVRNIMSDKILKPHIEHTGDCVYIDGTEIENDTTPIDFKKPVNLTIELGENKKLYTVYVHSFTGLPIMRIETDGRKKIETKEDYIDASFSLEENVTTKGAGDVTTARVQIKGRGNATWRYPKQPYRLKFAEKVSLLGMPKDKSWVLLANYKDRTSLRNWMSFFISSLSNLEYTPRSKFVELILNGEYYGTYQLCEKLKISNNRVNVGEDGYLLEFDEYAKIEEDARCIYTEHLRHPINVKEPECEYGDKKYEAIKNYILTAESVLYSDNFKDPENGWRKYLDEESFIEWYWVNEITKNLDGFRCSSTFFNKMPEGKLKIGPVWDFDHSFGDYVDKDYGSETYYGWWIKDFGWYKRLFEDELFSMKVSDRFNYFYSNKEILIDEINNQANYLKYSIEENDAKWATLYHPFSSDSDVWGSYINEVQYLKLWLMNRLEWMRNEINRY